MAYEDLIAIANEQRQSGKYEDALQSYKLAMEMSKADVCYCLHMIGVCYIRLHEYRLALGQLEHALELASAYEMGNIYRDMAEAHDKLGQYEEAEELYLESLCLLRHDMSSVDYVSTRWYFAKHQIKVGQLSEGLMSLEEADGALDRKPHDDLRLYVKLDLAEAFSQARRPVRSRRVACRALRLSLREGGRAHQVRALALLIGGRRLSNLVKMLG